MKTLTGQLRYWTLFLKSHSRADVFNVISNLRGHVRKLAISAAFALWGAAVFAQNDLHFAKKPLAEYGLVSGSHALIDADGDGDLDMLTVVDGHLNLQINEPASGVPSFGSLLSDPFGITEDSLSHIAVADLDNDGNIDMLISQQIPLVDQFYPPKYRFQYYKNSGNLADLQFDVPLVNPYGLSIAAETLGGVYAFLGVFYFADYDGDNDIEIIANRSYFGLTNPCGTSGSFYDTQFSYTYIYQQIADSTTTNSFVESFYGYENIIYFKSNFFADIDADGSIDRLITTKKRFTDTPFWDDVILFGNGDTAMLTGLPHSHFEVNQNMVGSLVDIDVDGDLDIVTNLEVLINEQNHAPQCTDIQVAVNIACHNTESYSFYEDLITFGYEDCADMPQNLGHYISRSALIENCTDADNDFIRDISFPSLPSNVDSILIHWKSLFYYYCTGNELTKYYAILLNEDGIMPYYLGSTDIAYNKGLFVKSTETASFQFQVSDGLLWSEPCTYTVIVAEAEGTVYHDQNANGTQDVGELLLPNYTLQSTLTNDEFTTNQTGEFDFFFSEIGDTVSPYNLFQVTASPANVVYNGGNQTVNFGVSFGQNTSDISPVFDNQPELHVGETSELVLTATNLGSIEQPSKVTIKFPATLDVLITEAVNITATTDSTIVFETANITAQGSLTYHLQVSVPMQNSLAGTVVNIEAETKPLALFDFEPSNDKALLVMPILDSLVATRQPSSTLITLTPNPTDGLLYISFEKDAAPIGGSVEVYNAVGRCVKTIYIKEKNLTLDTQFMPSGLYLCVFKDREGKLVGSAKWVRL